MLISLTIALFLIEQVSAFVLRFESQDRLFDPSPNRPLQAILACQLGLAEFFLPSFQVLS